MIRMKTKIKFLVLIVIINTLTVSVFCQKLTSVINPTTNDSVIPLKRIHWLDLSFGPAVTYNPKGVELILGVSAGYCWTNSKDRLYKIKAAGHAGISFQRMVELNFMTAIRKRDGEHAMEFHYGLGVIGGVKATEIIPERPGLWDFELLDLTEYKYKNFIFLCIPLEYRFQWHRTALGFEANLNPYLPYVGVKYSVNFGR